MPVTLTATTTKIKSSWRPSLIVGNSLAGARPGGRQPAQRSTHWVWITPVVIVLLVRARTAPGVSGWVAAGLAAVWVFTTAIRLVWLGDGVGADPEVAKYYRLLAANSYVVLAGLSLAHPCWLAWVQRGRRTAVERTTSAV